MTADDSSRRYRIDLSHDALQALLACLERVSGGDDTPLRSERMRANAADLMADVTRQTGVVLEKIEPRDLTAEAKALREKRCAQHVLSLSGRCVLCGEMPSR